MYIYIYAFVEYNKGRGSRVFNYGRGGAIVDIDYREVNERS